MESTEHLVKEVQPTAKEKHTRLLLTRIMRHKYQSKCLGHKQTPHCVWQQTEYSGRAVKLLMIKEYSAKNYSSMTNLQALKLSHVLATKA